MKSNLIQKSVRLPTEVIDFIEQQPGNNFSSKLLNLINEFINGDSDRCRSMKYSRMELERMQKELNGFYALIRSSRNLSTRYEHLIRSLQEELQQLEKERGEADET